MPEDHAESESGQDCMEEDAEAFDPALATQHAYLGELDDLRVEGLSRLEEGQIYKLPLLPLDGVVLVPGALLPLWLHLRSQVGAVEAALAAPAPLTRLILVVCDHWRHNASCMYTVGTVADIRRMRRDSSGRIHAVAHGCQRVKITSVEGGGWRAVVRVLHDDEAHRMPPPAAANAAFWPKWVYETYDAYRLAALARKMFLQISQKGAIEAGPLGLSFWLAANLPVGSDTRQRLLERHSPAERLLVEIRLMSNLSLQCAGCESQLASAQDVVPMSEEGIAGLFVNPHGFVHDMVTLRRVQNIINEGEPETEASWFPGYAWQLSYCSGCGQHMGWRFSATNNHLMPSEFWGIRRLAFEHSSIDDRDSE